MKEVPHFAMDEVGGLRGVGKPDEGDVEGEGLEGVAVDCRRGCSDGQTIGH